MQKLVRLRTRPSRNGKTFTFMLDYVNEQGKRRFKSLGHSDARKAERQRVQKERELRMGIVEPDSMRLSELLEDNKIRTRGQVRTSTQKETNTAMRDFIDIIGDIDFRQVNHQHGEQFMQACLDKGNSPATVTKKLKHLNRVFQLAVDRGQLEEHPLRRIRSLKVPRQQVRVYSDEECNRLIKAASELRERYKIEWDLLFQTGNRQGNGTRIGAENGPTWGLL